MLRVVADYNRNLHIRERVLSNIWELVHLNLIHFNPSKTHQGEASIVHKKSLALDLNYNNILCRRVQLMIMRMIVQLNNNIIKYALPDQINKPKTKENK